MTTEVTARAARYMDDMALWAVQNVVSLTAQPQHPNLADAATIESAHRALLAAQAMHRAARIERDVGRFQPGMRYISVYFSAIREFVTLGLEYTPEEPGDNEQPTIGVTLEISEVWLRGVDIGVLTTGHTDDLEEALKKAIKQGAEL